MAWISTPLTGLTSLRQMALNPDLTLYFDIEVEEGLARIAANSNREVNRLDLEGLDLHKKFVKAIFLFWTKKEIALSRLMRVSLWSRLWKLPRLSCLIEWD